MNLSSEDNNNAPAPADTVTAVDLLQTQRELELEAAEALPGRIDRCTHAGGYRRQPVYACLTCAVTSEDGVILAGYCYGCSVACHGDHNVLELFTKRHFRCDCGTERMKGTCQLRKISNEPGNSENIYGHNYRGLYCWCNQPYRCEDEESDMLQCIVCEDWYHEKCIGKIPDLVHTDDKEYDYICRDCTRKHAFLKRYVGSDGFLSSNAAGIASLSNTTSQHSSSSITTLSLAPLKSEDAHEIKSDNSLSTGSASELSNSNLKRNLEHEEDDANSDTAHEEKKRRITTSENSCKLEQKGFLVKSDDDKLVDIFGEKIAWRQALCRCPACMELYRDQLVEYILEEEEVLEPEEDNEASTSLYERGMAALERMDRVQAVRGVTLFKHLENEFKAFAAPFARDGKIVTKEDIEQFFARLSERNHQRQMRHNSGMYS